MLMTYYVVQINTKCYHNHSLIITRHLIIQADLEVAPKFLIENPN